MEVRVSSMSQIELFNHLLKIIYIYIWKLMMERNPAVWRKFKFFVFHRSLSDSKSPQVSRTLLGILSDLKNDMAWMVSIHPLISKLSSPFINPLVTVLNFPITSDITVTFMFHFFFSVP